MPAVKLRTKDNLNIMAPIRKGVVMNKLAFEKNITHPQEPFPYTSFDDLPIYEQRYLPRWVTQNRAYYRRENVPAIFRTQIEDLNLTGACLHIQSDVQTNQQLKLKIYLTDKMSFTASGTIMWKRTTSGSHCYAGILFDPLPNAIQDLILKHAFEPERSFSQNI